MYYQCSENKSADQLWGYHEADLRLCFHICKKQVFLRHAQLKHCLENDDYVQFTEEQNAVCYFDDNLRRFLGILQKQVGTP